MGTTGTSSGALIKQSGSKVVASNKLTSVMFDATGTDRNDLINNIAKTLGTSANQHLVWTGKSKHIVVDGAEITFVTRKSNGAQIVTRFDMLIRNDKGKMIAFSSVDRKGK